MKKLRKTAVSSALVFVSVLTSGTGLARRGEAKIDLFAATVQEQGDGSLGENGEASLSFLHDRPVVEHAAINVLHIDPEALAIDIQLPKNQVERINAMVERFPEKRLAFVSDGRLLLAPKIKAKLTSQTLHLTFKDRKEFSQVRDVLANAD